MRRESTYHENCLWYRYLRNYPVQFRRQKQFARYIVDFYCSSAKLVIELDGKQHDQRDAVVHDYARTIYLESLGLMVLRFANQEIEDDFETVCFIIDQAVKPEVNKPSPLGKVARRNAVTDEVPPAGDKTAGSIIRPVSNSQTIIMS